MQKWHMKGLPQDSPFLGIVLSMPSSIRRTCLEEKLLREEALLNRKKSFRRSYVKRLPSRNPLEILLVRSILWTPWNEFLSMQGPSFKGLQMKKKLFSKKIFKRVSIQRWPPGGYRAVLFNSLSTALRGLP